MNSKRLKDSLALGFVIITGLATAFTLLGFSSKDAIPLTGIHWFPALLVRAVILFVVYCLIVGIIWFYKGHKYKESISLKIGKNKVVVKTGDIFQEDAWRVIPVDTHFDTVVDNKVISEDSLHGQLVLKHGDQDSINATVKKEAEKRGKKLDSRGKYTFDLGKAIPYDGHDGHYIMIALTSLNSENEARTSMAQYETTLMAMWREINRVYSGNQIALPILGGGISFIGEAGIDFGIEYSSIWYKRNDNDIIPGFDKLARNRGIRMRIKEKIELDLTGLIEHGPLNLVAFGDSVTHGCVGPGEYDYESVYWNRLRRKLNTVNPSMPVNAIDAGINGITAKASLERIERDVLSHHPDLVIVCFGLNDVNSPLDEYLASLKDIFHTCRDGDRDTVFMTPNMLNTRVAPDTPPEYLSYAGVTADYQNNGRMDLYMKEASDLARECGIAVCDCYSEWKRRSKTEDVTMLLANRINHPVRDMHELFASRLFDTVMGQ